MFYKRTTVVCMLIAAFVMLASSIAWLTTRIVKMVDFGNNCTQYIERAANSASVETAKEELDKAILYLESHELTDGFVTIVMEQPRNDIGFWYQNLVNARDELEMLQEGSSSLEKSNILMKLRETLLDDDKVIVPEGIEIYPYNKLYFAWSMSFLASIILFILAYIFD